MKEVDDNPLSHLLPVPIPHTTSRDTILSDKKSAKLERKQRKAALLQETHEDDAASIEKAEKKKKRKRAAPEDAQPESKDEEEPVTKKRKHRNKTGFPDPEEDESLTEQSQKALSYAFLQFHRPKKWKFNKARQNWIIRNTWSVEAVPDIYYPLVLQYLSRVQGGVRENLLKTCRSIIDDEKQAPAPDANTAPTVGGALVQSDSNVPPPNGKVTRAKILLETLTKSES